MFLTREPGGPVQVPIQPVKIGKAVTRREGTDLTMAGVGVSFHRALDAADNLEKIGLLAEVLDLRTVSPLDNDALCRSLSKTSRLLVIDEDYCEFDLSGELAARVSESGIPFRYDRVCTEKTIPYNRDLEDQTLPNTKRIDEAAMRLFK